MPPPQQKSDRTIIKFSRRKDCEQVVIRVKKDLKNLNPTDLDFLEETRLFINDSLCPYYRGFGTNGKNYGSIKNIFVLFSFSSMVQFCWNLSKVEEVPRFDFLLTNISSNMLQTFAHRFFKVVMYNWVSYVYYLCTLLSGVRRFSPALTLKGSYLFH